MDLEARGHSEHPEALRLWLRMLTLHPAGRKAGA